MFWIVKIYVICLKYIIFSGYEVGGSMIAIIFCEETIGQIYDRNFFRKFNSDETIIITTESCLHREIQNLYPIWKCEFINLYDDHEFVRAKKIAEQVINGIKAQNEDEDTKKICEISINSVYEIYARIIVQVQIQISKLIKKYDIKKLYLYGGNQRVPYFPLNMAEGERPFSFMYKRRWFLNPIIYSLFSEDTEIKWKQELAFPLKVKRKLRISILNLGKMCKIAMKNWRLHPQKDIKYIDEKQIYIGIVVRTSNQLNSVLPIYKAIEVETEYHPLILSYENYSNNNLEKDIESNNLNHINIREKADFIEAVKCYLSIKICKKKEYRYLQIGSNLKMDAIYLSKEMKCQWWDARLLVNSFNKSIRSNNIKLKSVINVETYNWCAAIQAIWAKNMRIPIYSIQFVTLDLRPHLVWADKYFFMSLNEQRKFDKYVENGKCAYVGPICYDNIFNSTKHVKGILKNIVILTQPDNFRNDSIRLIEDILKIRDECNEKWKICIKLHPREDDVAYFKKNYGNRQNVIIYHNEVNSTNILTCSDLAIGIISTTLYQSVIIGTPAISVNYNNTFKYVLDVVENGVVKKIQDYKELMMYLENYGVYENEFYLMRDKYIKNSLGEYCGKGAKKLAEMLNK